MSYELEILSQQIPLRDGWGIFSTYLEPLENNFDSIFADLDTNLIEVSDEFGNTYYPDSSNNSLDSITIGEAYEINVDDADTLTITGLPIIPEETELLIDSGWSMVGYLRQNIDDVVEVMASIHDDILIVKNEVGIVYWPEYYVYQFEKLTPGRGYDIKMQDTIPFYSLIYIPNSSSSKSHNIKSTPTYYKDYIKTNNSLAIGIPDDAWEMCPEIGDEIGILDSQNNLVGSNVYHGENLPICVWGDDHLTKEKDGLYSEERFTIRLFRKQENSEEILKVERWKEGSNQYVKDGIYIVGLIVSEHFNSSSFKLYQNYPNPFSEQTTIRFYLPQKSNITIHIFDIFGKLVKTIPQDVFYQGNNKIIINCKNLDAGTYFYKVVSGKYCATRKMIIVK
ncbi:MAG: T9SS type A sorting domain-containing protein [Bacteroidetes bacterium]|jgi:hypothetical protein|nr:T9SS type A sorting domain-containing protein [Bacteroidota bacterium]MBT4969608.1 T9SS type A sorting domain-containing protein [Bacteroidota bacterium]MBT7144314.1 T9SS type A sorting domain-containing protein [Bacteroidota bacterium]MBT7491307.1 T9SS type A sorting domain-containing protein [Bacteroidota bacterium]